MTATPNNVNRDTEIVQPRYRPDTVMIEQPVITRVVAPQFEEGRNE